MDLVADIKARLNVEDVVGQYVQLKKMGRNFKGLCPFHNEKTPSFHVSTEKQLAYCFGCHQGGDIFQFVQLVEGIDFPAALKMLAERAGLDYSEYRTTMKKIPSKSEKEPFYDAHEESAKFFQKHLWETEDGKKVLEYLRNRGMTDETIRKFRLGFSPDENDALYQHLSKLGLSKTVLVQSGLVSSRDVNADKVYDRFRGRLIFPIFNIQGQIVAFGGRALKKGMEPKYLNSPETPLYHKSDILYGMHVAKNPIREKGVLLVEGYMDCLACHQAGFDNTVATSGTALTEQHVRLLNRFTDTFYFSFDRDNAGWEASKRGFSEVLRQQGIVKVVEIPEGKDPADALLHSREPFGLAVEHARAFLDVYFDHLFAQFGSGSSEDAARIIGEAIPLLQQISNRIVLDLAVRDLSRRMQVRESSIYDQLRNTEVRQERSRPSSDESLPLSLKRINPEQTVLAVLFQFPERLDFVREHFSLEMADEDFRAIFELLFSFETLDMDVFLEKLNDEDKKRVDFLSFYGENVYSQLRSDELGKILKISLDKIAVTRKNKQLGALKQAISEYERAGKMEESKAALKQLQDLKNQV